MTTIKAKIERRLEAAFAPARLAVVDQSAQHAGHAGARPEGETHFLVEVVSEAFAGQNRVARQRAVHEALADLLAGRVHALSLRVRTPEEAG